MCSNLFINFEPVREKLHVKITEKHDEHEFTFFNLKKCFKLLNLSVLN